MTNSIISLGVVLFAFAMLTGVLLAPIAFLAGSVFHAWGTSSTLEWSAEAVRRVFAGSVRRRLMRKVNRQSHIGVDKSRRTCAYLAVSVATGDVTALTGHGGDLSHVAADAVKGYLRNAEAQGRASDAVPQVAIVPDESLRRGTVHVRPVAGQVFIGLWREMVEWDQAAKGDELALAPEPVTQRLSNGEAASATAFDPAHAVTRPAMSEQIVFADARGTQHPISSASVLIGRGRECGVRLDGAAVSREHVNVYFQEGTWWLRDRGSRNGTTVDGREVKSAGPVRLTSGSQIVLGGAKSGEKLTIASLVEL